MNAPLFRPAQRFGPEFVKVLRCPLRRLPQGRSQGRSHPSELIGACPRASTDEKNTRRTRPRVIRPSAGSVCVPGAPRRTRPDGDCRIQLVHTLKVSACKPGLDHPPPYLYRVQLGCSLGSECVPARTAAFSIPREVNGTQNLDITATRRHRARTPGTATGSPKRPAS